MYLLDTHTLVWAIGAPKLLSPKARALIRDHPVLVSVVSFWELIVKCGKPDAPVVRPGEWWSRYVVRQELEVLPIRAAHVAQLEFLPAHHKDPFDRLLIAQAAADGLTLITRDEQVRRYDVATAW
jgi:PIN domain nuclease of toxin-antitoxin system